MHSMACRSERGRRGDLEPLNLEKFSFKHSMIYRSVRGRKGGVGGGGGRCKFPVHIGDGINQVTNKIIV